MRRFLAASLVFAVALLPTAAPALAEQAISYTTIHSAAAQGDISVIYTLLSRGIDVDQADSAGKTALQVALEHSQAETARWLVDHGADITVKDHARRSVLHWAILGHNPAFARQLIMQGADIQAKTQSGKTPLALAAEAGLQKIVDLLLQKGARPDAAGAVVELHPAFLAAKAGHFSIARQCMPKKNPRPFVLAFYADKKTFLHALKKHGLSLSARLPLSRDTLLHCAVRGNNRSVARYLLKHTSLLNTVNANLETPLHLAVQRHSPGMVKLLLASGALLHLRNRQGQTALEQAQLNHDAALAKLLMAHEKRIAVLLRAVAAGDLAVTKKHVKKLGTANVTDRSGSNVWHYAVKYNRLALFPFLAHTDADINQQDFLGNTPLHLAVNQPQTTALEQLLHFKADPYLTNRLGLAPSHLAAKNNRQVALALLLRHGVSILLEDEQGFTVFDRAKQANKQDLLRWIKRHGGKPGSGLPPRIARLSKPLAQAYVKLLHAIHVNETAVKQSLAAAGSQAESRAAAFEQKAQLYASLEKNVLALVSLAETAQPHEALRKQCKLLARQLALVLEGLFESRYDDFQTFSNKYDAVLQRIQTLKLRLADETSGQAR